LAYLEFNRKDYAKLIDERELLIADTKNTIAELYADPQVIPVQRERLSNYDKRCPKECGRFGGGNRSCRNYCDRNWHIEWEKDLEKRRQAEKQHIHPLHMKIKNYETEIAAIKEKQNIPILREQLRTATAEYRTLSPNDPEFRQKQIDQKKSLYEKSITTGTAEFNYKNLAIAGAGIFAVLALIIWRFK
jgi:hypothetical protein